MLSPSFPKFRRKKKRLGEAFQCEERKKEKKREEEKGKEEYLPIFVLFFPFLLFSFLLPFPSLHLQTLTLGDFFQFLYYIFLLCLIVSKLNLSFWIYFRRANLIHTNKHNPCLLISLNHNPWITLTFPRLNLNYAKKAQSMCLSKIKSSPWIYFEK